MPEAIVWRNEAPLLRLGLEKQGKGRCFEVDDRYLTPLSEGLLSGLMFEDLGLVVGELIKLLTWLEELMEHQTARSLAQTS